MLPHRGADPEAIKVAERYDLLFDGMMAGCYEFTTSENYPMATRGITFLVEELNQVKTRLDEKLAEFKAKPPEFLPMSQPATVIRTSPRWDRMVRHLGYEPVNPSGAQPNLQTDVELIQQSQERLKEIKIIPPGQLGRQQQNVLALVRAIANEVAPVRGVEAAVIPAASDRVRTAGLYSQSQREIYIAPEQLHRGRDAVDTIAHELGHHESRAEDGDPRHQEAIDRIASSMVKVVREGKFDALLKDVEW